MDQWEISVPFRGRSHSIKVTLEAKDEKGITLKVRGRRSYQILKFVYESQEQGRYPIPSHWELLAGEKGMFANEKERIQFDKALLGELNLIITSLLGENTEG